MVTHPFRLGRVTEKRLSHCTHMLENGADLYVNKRQKIHYCARSAEERRRMPNHDFSPRATYVNCAIVAMLYINLIRNKP